MKLSGIELGLDSYEENVVAEVRELAAENTVIKAIMGQHKYKIHDLSGHLSVLKTMLSSSVVDTNDVVSLSYKLAPYTKKLELSSFTSTISTLRHTYSLFSFAIHLMNTGKEVWLIESCDSKGNQLLADLDLMFYDGTSRVAVDVTGDIKLAEGQIKIWKRAQKEKKYNKLELLNEIDKTLVISYGIPQECYNLQKIEFNVFKDCPREKDFQFVDETLPAFKSLSWIEGKTNLK